MSATAYVKAALRSIIPPAAFKVTNVKLQKTGLGKYRILRITTPAWKSLPKFERILKIQKAIEAGLSEKQRAQILRISVLTANESKRLLHDNGAKH